MTEEAKESGEVCFPLLPVGIDPLSHEMLMRVRKYVARHYDVRGPVIEFKRHTEAERKFHGERPPGAVYAWRKS